MTEIAPYLSSFLREHLPRERQASFHTCETYSYAFQLLICFAASRFKTQPSDLTLEQLDAPLILTFLEFLENERGNSARTRNARLAAIHAFFRYLEYHLPSCLDQSRRIRAIPLKKTDERLIDYLTREEAQAILDSPDPKTLWGIRDRAMLHLAFAAGLRVSELVGLQFDDLKLLSQPVLHVIGKGKRERILPLWKETVATLRAWIEIRGKEPVSELFLNSHRQAMTRSGFEYILAKHVKRAMKIQPSLGKKHVSPHVLRHSCAMHILQATRDVRKVALWLGHASIQSTEVYLRADPSEKLEALSAGIAPTIRRGHFRAPDKVLAMLKSSKKENRYAK